MFVYMCNGMPCDWPKLIDSAVGINWLYSCFHSF